MGFMMESTLTIRIEWNGDERVRPVHLKQGIFGRGTEMLKLPSATTTSVALGGEILTNKELLEIEGAWKYLLLGLGCTVLIPGGKLLPCLRMPRAKTDLFEYVMKHSNGDNHEHIKEHIKAAIIFLHENDFFHGDIKPENVVLYRERWKLIDFNTCGRKKTEHPGYTYTQTPGSEGYQPPEVLKAASQLEDIQYVEFSRLQQVDIWAFGIIWYILKFGEYPFVPTDVCTECCLSYGRFQMCSCKEPDEKGPFAMNPSERDMENEPTVFNKERNRRHKILWLQKLLIQWRSNADV